MPEQTCAEPNCDLNLWAKGLCSKHYARARRSDPKRGTCSEPGCDLAYFANGYCNKHNNTRHVQATCPTCGDVYQRWIKAKAPGCLTCFRATRPRSWPSSRVRITDCASCGALFVKHGKVRARRNHCEQCHAILAAEKHRQDAKTLFAERMAAQLAQRRCVDCDEPVNRVHNIRCDPCKERHATVARRDHMHRRRAVKRGLTADRIDSHRVYERDNWTCGICRRQVKKELKYPHPRSASLDHIVPIAWGGEHTYANTQCAHLNCNIRKSHRPAYAQPAIF